MNEREIFQNYVYKLSGIEPLNYENAIENSEDEGLKAQAYMKMAQIQYDNSKLKDAGENYFGSFRYAKASPAF